MKRVDLHPEDLLDHLRDGELRPEEQARLDRHCDSCHACSFERRWIETQRQHAEPTVGDQAIAARVIDRMFPGHDEPSVADHEVAARVIDRMFPSQVEGSHGDHASHATATNHAAAELRAVDSDDEALPMWRPARAQGVFRAAALLLAGVLVGGSVSAAALTGGNPFMLIDVITAWVAPGTTQRADDAAATTTTRVQVHRTHEARARQKPDPDRASDDAIAAPSVEAHSNEVAMPSVTPATDAREDVPVAAPRRMPLAEHARGVAEARTPIARQDATKLVNVIDTDANEQVDPATWLFRAASRARVAGRFQEAVALYGVLQRDYMGSETEVVARVALGRLWLSQLHDATHALSAFDSYLLARPHGRLAEEARSGRVRALRALGRDADAQRALADLISHHPSSLYAKAATSPAP